MPEEPFSNENDGNSKTGVGELSKDSQLLLKDFDLAWQYYNRNLDERNRLFELFLKFVSLPLFVVSSVIALVPLSSPSEQTDKVSSIFDFLTYKPLVWSTVVLFGVSWLLGFIIYIVMIKEEQVGKDYLAFMGEVRNLLKKEHPWLKGYLKIKPPKHSPFGKVSFWRTLKIVVPLSAISATAILLWLTATDRLQNINAIPVLTKWLQWFTASGLVHVLVWLVLNWYGPKPNSDNKEKDPPDGAAALEDNPSHVGLSTE